MNNNINNNHMEVRVVVDAAGRLVAIFRWFRFSDTEGAELPRVDLLFAFTKRRSLFLACRQVVRAPWWVDITFAVGEQLAPTTQRSPISPSTYHLSEIRKTAAQDFVVW